jgi:hypothetical protein
MRNIHEVSTILGNKTVKTYLRRYKNLFEKQELSLFVNFGLFRIRIPNMDPDNQINAEPDIDNFFANVFFSFIAADS